jgi:hypothetical protein
MYELRFPIGEFKKPETITGHDLEQWLDDIETFPAAIRSEVEKLTPEQLDTPYRPGGWTIRQVVHHCADSHMNSLTRLKLALTEDKPTIKPYYEDRWAELNDSKSMPVEPALQMIVGLHSRWVGLLKSLNEEELGRTFIHPEHNREIRIDENIGLYAWHCSHHLAHIKKLKESKGWK